MPFIVKLKTLLPSKVYYIAFAILLVSLYQYLFLFLVIYLFLIRKKEVFKITLIFTILMGLRIYINKIIVYKEPPISFQGEIVAVKEKYYFIKYENQKVMLYTDDVYECGDIVKIKGKITKISYPKMPLVFDFTTYLARKRVFYKISAYDTKYVKHHYGIKEIRYQALKFVDKNYNNSIAPFYKSLILGSSDDLVIKEDLKTLGISHLFAISGLHILLIVGVLKKFLKERYINSFLIVYIILTGFLPSVMRASLVVILKSIFDKFKIPFTNLDSLSIVFIGLLIYNPYYIYDVGFELSFIVSFALLITPMNSKHSLIKVSLLAQVITLPIIVNINNEMNIFTIIFNVLIVGFFVKIFLPSTFVSILIPNIFLYKWLVKYFSKAVNKLAGIKQGIIEIGNFSPLNTIIYYIAVFIFFRYRKVYPLFLIVGIVVFQQKALLSDNLYICDVGQGDSTVVINRDETIMIDCYGSSYELLKKKGVKELDYLFLTHGHDDHVGDVLTIIEQFNVKNIFVSYYDNSDLITPIKDLSIKLKAGDSIKTKKLKIDVLAPFNPSDDLNDISLVLSFDFHQRKYLFMGDLGIKVEKQMIKEYGNKLKCDVLKVGHHGSNTSSCEEFIKLVNPSLAVISVAKYNKYNLPSDETIELFSKLKINIFLTSEKNTYCDSNYFGIIRFDHAYTIYVAIRDRKKSLMFI